MKKLLAIILAMLFLLMAGCGQTAPSGGTQAPTETTTVSAEETTAPADEITVEEYEFQGAKSKNYYQGGILIRTEFSNPDGSYGEQDYYADGTPSHSIYHNSDGSVFEESYYPNGCWSKMIMTNPDGSYTEFHYADNGYFDEETQAYHSGTTTYQKEVAADGTVIYETASDLKYEEDGSYWETFNLEDGSIQESRYSADGVLLEDRRTEPDTGAIYETEYYENRYIKKSAMTKPDSPECYCTEYYENGYMKYEAHTSADGTGGENRYNEAGLLLYSHTISLYGEDEFFADDEGNLIKYVENGTVYEGDAISSQMLENFQYRKDFAQELQAASQQMMLDMTGNG